MPMYVYVCSKCDYTSEKICSIEDGLKYLDESCPDCGSDLIRPITANRPVIQLRGYSPAHPRFFRGMRK